MSEIDGNYVKRGYWVNVDRGSTMGGTITTDIETGTVIVALLSVLSAVAVSHVWQLLLFAIHQYRARGGSADGLFRQQQALLRASPEPSSFVSDWVKLWWVWRGTSPQALIRSAPQLALAILFASGTIAVGIFSSYVIDSTNLEVLVDSSTCAPLNIYNPLADTWPTNMMGTIPYRTQAIARSKAYAAECYGNTTASLLPARCRAFVRPNIPLPHELVNCPFDKKVCTEEQHTVSVDSGLINAAELFGWNFAPKDRVSFRRKATVGMIRSEGYSSVIDASSYHTYSRPLLPGEKLLLSHYGTEIAGGEWANATFANSFMAMNVSKAYLPAVQQSFGAAEYNATYSDFVPLPELQVSHADLTLVTIYPNQMKYGKPVDDPFFAAHKAFELQLNYMSESTTQYFSDSPSSSFGCLEQYQFCFAKQEGPDYCTELSHLPAKVSSDIFPGASDIQLAAIQLLVTGSLLTDTAVAASKVLQADDISGKSSGYVESLPDDQWIREVVGWENFIWTSLQTFISDYAVGYSEQERSTRDFMRENMTDAERGLCGMQKMMKTGGFVNINVFGLAFIITLSSIVALVDLVLLKFLIFVPKIKQASPRIGRWIQDGVFQWQRRAYEANNEGTWRLLDKEVPVTVDARQLSELPLEMSHFVEYNDDDFRDPKKLARAFTAATDATAVSLESPKAYERSPTLSKKRSINVASHKGKEVNAIFEKSVPEKSPDPEVEAKDWRAPR